MYPQKNCQVAILVYRTEATKQKKLTNIRTKQ